MKYDYLIVGSGLFGATFAHLAHKADKSCLVLDKRPQLGGNIYCEQQHGINVHKYGAHIFHTSDAVVWNFVTSLVPFNRFTNSPVALYGGKLQYRTVRFEEEVHPVPNWQGCAVVNYTEREIPWTRIIEHKHFESFGAEVEANPTTIISKEFSTEWTEGSEPFYPVNDAANTALAEQYRALAALEPNIIFGGRLAEYKYYDMAPVIAGVLRHPEITALSPTHA